MHIAQHHTVVMPLINPKQYQVRTEKPCLKCCKAIYWMTLTVHQAILSQVKISLNQSAGSTNLATHMPSGQISSIETIIAVLQFSGDKLLIEITRQQCNSPSQLCVNDKNNRCHLVWQSKCI